MSACREHIYNLLQGSLLKKDLSGARRAHFLMVSHGLDSVSVLCDHLIRLFSLCGQLFEATLVFCNVSQPSSFTWQASIYAHVVVGENNRAIQLYHAMHASSDCTETSKFVLSCVLKACSGMGRLGEEEGRHIHSCIVKSGLDSDVVMGSALIDMYAKCGNAVEAMKLFNRLPSRNVVSWGAILTCYMNQEAGFVALELFEKMQREQVLLNDVTLVCVLQACSATGSLELCRNLHFSIVSAGCDLNPALVTTLIHAYGNCASMADAQAFFDKILGYDVVSWNACISGHMEEGNFAACLHMFEKLKLAEVKPDKVTFTAILSVCCQAGLVAKGLEYFEQMSRDYGVEPELKHYGSMLGLLGHTGEFKRLESMLQSMPMQANLIIWSCLLKACCLHGNVALAKQAFNSATNMHSNNPGFTSLLS